MNTMKKSLLALAVLGAFAGVASAQTNVTVYGLVDAGVTFEGGGAAGSVTKLATGVQSGNRLGFKGTEDLGGGLKANFQIESGFDLDTGTGRQGALFGRQAWVGLSGGFGAVGLGRQYTPLFIALDSIDPFETGLTGATTNLMNPSTVRTNNAITYSTPNLSGFSANLLYGLGEVAGDNSAGRSIGLSVGYANGPLNIVLAHDNTNNKPSAIAPVVLPNKTKLTLLGGTYNFGVVKLHAAYETEKDDAATDFRDFMVGASAPLGAGTILASYIQKKDRSAAGNAGGKQFALGYTYALSKRTNLYTSYGQINNDSAGVNTVGDASSGGTAPKAGDNSRAFTVGVRHKF
jgi:predicted porin